MSKYLVFDIGGTNIKYGIINRSGQLIEKHRFKTPTESLAAFLAPIQQLIDQYQGQYDGLAFSIPGKVRHPDEIIYGGGSLPFLDRQRLADHLSVPTGVPVMVENDGKAAALAELWLGNLKDCQNGVALVLGTGVGGGLVLNGQLFSGSHFQAGELSFMLSDTDETMTGMLGLRGSAVAMIEQIATELKLVDHHDGLKVFEAINAGEPTAVKIFTAYCHTIALTIQNMQSVIDVERYVIGGGISAQPIVASTIRSEYLKLYHGLPIIETTLTAPAIMTGKFSNDANLYGALYHLLQSLE
ncbi:ROK family protein [Lactiplantibacillus fabifermentans]|nr:ROK family protein [Lactiplantibacillus fabifermentans]ETY72926.1 transcriptional regulator [Lactiplantibacillus fabifermentans T30PCM01]